VSSPPAGATPVRIDLSHLPRTAVPTALAELHGALASDTPVELGFLDGDLHHAALLDDPSGDRCSAWDPKLLAAVVEGAGFGRPPIELRPRTGPPRRSSDELGSLRGQVLVSARRLDTLPDSVGPAMRLLVCGLNPSLPAAATGIPFVGASNRFWPAARQAGVVAVDRDPAGALTVDRVGFTDQAKRATAAASSLRPGELRRGIRRLARLVAWLEPAAVCVVGLAGWRTAVDAHARPGIAEARLGGRPVYVMPSTSGRNARSSVDALTAHLADAAALADRAAAELDRHPT
jgi:TDG/mug DNA glycosylase family protein